MNLARALMAGYAGCCELEDFQIVEIEKPSTDEIRNPDTGRCSQTFVMSGKADAIVRRAEGLYLLEHKRASSVDASYLDKLWIDTQIAIDSYCLPSFTRWTPRHPSQIFCTYWPTILATRMLGCKVASTFRRPTSIPLSHLAAEH